jgi:hypothetical protein
VTDIDQFLREAVFYPCSGQDGAPVRFLAKRFQRFFYADYAISREAFDHTCTRQGFRGYRICEIRNLEVESIFLSSWENIGRSHRKLISRLHFDWSQPFVAAARFERLPAFTEDHGPPDFELIFARCEAIATFVSVFIGRGITPRCLAYIRSGIGFGGNYSDFPQELDRTLRDNRAGLPEFMLYDEMGADPRCGDYLRLVEAYEQIENWDYHTEGYGAGNVSLARLKTKGQSAAGLLRTGSRPHRTALTLGSKVRRRDS